MIRDLVPWWTRIGAKMVLSRLPFDYSVWQQLGLFRHGSMDQSEYAIGVADRHVRAAGFAASLEGRTILELGPGDSIATVMIAAARAGRAVLVDAGYFIREDVTPYERLAAALRNRGTPVPGNQSFGTVADIIAQCHGEYRSDGLAGLRSLPTASMDLIFSQAVLEHVRVGEFDETMQECRRVLKPGGAFTNQVDLRDHLGGGLNNLRFHRARWESNLFARSGFYTNRIRYSDMLRRFRAAGFSIETVETVSWKRLPTPRRALAPEFRSLSDEELCVSSFFVVLR